MLRVGRGERAEVALPRQESGGGCEGVECDRAGPPEHAPGIERCSHLPREDAVAVRAGACGESGVEVRRSVVGREDCHVVGKSGVECFRHVLQRRTAFDVHTLIAGDLTSTPHTV